MRACIACGCGLPEQPLMTLDHMPASAQNIPDGETVAADEGITLNLCQCPSCGLVQFDCEPVDYYRDVIRAGGFSTTMVELRKGKMTEEQCRAALKQGNYFGTMLVKMGYADALLGGATYSTADTVRPALQIIKTKPGSTIVSSCFILVRPSATGDREVLAMGDCAINIKPTADELVPIPL